MSIYVKSTNPRLLVENIRSKIKLQEIKTWTVDKDGDFTHSTEQWENCAWICPKIEDENRRVVFYILGRKDRNVSTLEYAIYHGRFVEMLLTHFDSVCDSIEVSALASRYDRIDTNPKTSL